MTIPVYTARVTNESGKIVAWIDKDNNLCIEQPNHPNLLSTGENWSSEAEAQAWADQHAAELTQSAIDTEAKMIAEEQAKAQEAAARQAILDNATKIDEIHAMLTQLTNN